MNRIVIFEKNGEVMAQREHLSKQPSGNGDQRRKQIRNGWRPEWVRESAPRPLKEVKNIGAELAPGSFLSCPPVGATPAPPEIEVALRLAYDRHL